MSLYSVLFSSGSVCFFVLWCSFGVDVSQLFPLRPVVLYYDFFSFIFFLPDTAKARDFLLQRISQDFKLCRRSVRNESNPGSNPEPRFHLPSSEVRDTDPMEGELSAVNRQRDCNTRPPV